MRLPVSAGLIAAAIACVAAPAQAVPVTWTDWSTIGSSSGTGTMGSVGVSLSAVGPLNGVSQTGCGTNYWTEPNASDKPYTGGTVSNGPTACEQVGISSPVTVTLTFSQAVNTLYLALLSVGQPGVTITYDFNQSFVVDSEGQGYWGNDTTNGIVGAGDTLTMREFHGVLRFSGPVTSISFSTSPTEYWQAFTVGYSDSVIPEPAGLALVASALLAGALASRRAQARRG